MTLPTHVAFASVLYLGGATLFGYKPDWISWGLAVAALAAPLWFLNPLYDGAVVGGYGSSKRGKSGGRCSGRCSMAKNGQRSRCPESGAPPPRWKRSVLPLAIAAKIAALTASTQRERG